MKKTFWLVSLVCFIFIACSGTSKEKSDLVAYFVPAKHTGYVEFTPYSDSQRNIMAYRVNAAGDSIQVLDSMVQLNLPSKVNIVSSYFVTDSVIYLVRRKADLELVPEKAFDPIPVFKMPAGKEKRTWSHPGQSGKVFFTSEWTSVNLDGIAVKAVKITRRRETATDLVHVAYYAHGYGLVRSFNSDEQGNEDVYSKLEFKRFVNGTEK